MISTGLRGAFGTGKTTATVRHLLDLITTQKTPANNILVLVPQRTLALPYQIALTESDAPNTAGIDVVTIGGIAQRTIIRFWPLLSKAAGFASVREPNFLTIETAQYHMAQFVDKVIESGRFDSISVARPRLIAQSLDNLAKAAINGFSLEEVAQRLAQSWGGHSSREQVYDSWLDAARQFRTYCLENNLLDFSLQIEVFAQHGLQLEPVASYLTTRYRHLIADNLEEQSPIALDVVRWLWPTLESAWLVMDDDAGFRIFLGAEPEGAKRLLDLCDNQRRFTESHIQSNSMQALSVATDAAFYERELPTVQHNPAQAFSFAYHAFYPQMLDWACEQVVYLVQKQNVQPRDVVIIAPFLNDSLRFSVMNMLQANNIPIVSHRPSRPIREEQAARAMLTLMQLVNPYETAQPPGADVANALTVMIAALDPIRARLLTEVVYGSGRDELGSFDDLKEAKMQTRITFRIGERYEVLRRWLVEQRALVAQTPPDYFLRRLFGDVAAQPGFGLQQDFEAATVISQMVDSAADFRLSLYPDGTEDWSPVWQLYRELVTEGLLAAFHAPGWQQESANTVFIAPAYTFLMRNRSVKHQIWLDVGSRAWAERLDQPLTHPYVVRRDYPEQRIWTDEDEEATSWEALYRLVIGLMRRCSKQIHLGIADLGEQGFEQRGPLLYLFQQILQTYDEQQDDT
jgi:hypothetical protein